MFVRPLINGLKLKNKGTKVMSTSKAYFPKMNIEPLSFYVFFFFKGIKWNLKGILLRIIWHLASGNSLKLDWS
ncbi:hypothetical protein AsAng_0047010 [Aureispira anguillae]|uniref:Uncharacterized protein n=1 Tax=Aureispira anguillae TaxID=2864201 RepID=A0A915YJF0_9BACT|nr:hypothetical protein AsAng_0047010 [Aureispira anguillae]